MAVNTPQTEITPFTSTVPLVHIPPDAMEQQSRPAQPLQGEFGKKGTGALAIGDSILKGFLAGHQAKEQRNFQQGQAKIAAFKASTDALYQNYQQLLSQVPKGVDGKPDQSSQQWKTAQDAYTQYVGTYKAGKDSIAEYVIGNDNKGKPKQKAEGAKGKLKKGWDNFSDFFAANPHFVPQMALAAMQPIPPGMSPATQETVQNLESQRLANETARVRQQNENTYQQGFTTYAHLSPEEVSALPPDAKKGYETWANARASLTPMKFSGTPQLYKLPNGKVTRLYKEEADQYYPDAEPYIASQEAKPGTPGFYLQAKAKELGKDVNSLSTEEIESAMGQYRASQTPGSTTTSSTTTDPQGNRTTTTKRTATPGGTQPPPKASGASASGPGKPLVDPKTLNAGGAKAGKEPPPGYKPTWQTAQATTKAVTKQQAGYTKAEATRTKAYTAADQAWQTAVRAAKDDPNLIKNADAVRDAAKKLADAQLEMDKAAVAMEYDAAVRAIGGSTGSQQQSGPPEGATMAYKDPKTGQVVGYAVNGVYVPVGQK